MKFEKKSAAEIAAMSADDQEKYITAKESHDLEVRKGEIENATEPMKKDLLAIKAGQDTTVKQLKEVADSVVSLEEILKGGFNGGQTLEKTVEDWVTENHEKIKTAFKSGAGKLDLSTIKAPALVTTANGTLPTALPANFAAESLGVDRIALRRPYLFDIVRNLNTNKATFAYIEAVPGEGDFTVVAEGGTKPQLDIDWVTRYATPVKFAGWIKVTEEVVEDIPRLRDTIVSYLKDKHDIFKDNQIFAAINTAATAYTAGSLTGTVTDPNIIDVVNALQVQILNAPNYTDEPDFYADTVLLNPIDFFKYFATVKDAMGRNLYSDQMMLGGSMVYNGLRFISTKQVTAGNIIVFDSTKVNLTEYIGYHVEIGWVNDDFIKNQFVILGESRGHIYITNHDKRAFAKGSIATIVADLTKAGE